MDFKIEKDFLALNNRSKNANSGSLKKIREQQLC